MEKGEKFYKTAKETETRRNQKKLTDKQLWYKGWGKKMKKEGRKNCSNDGSRHPEETGKGRKTKEDGSLEVASVLSVQRTSNGVLAAAIREEETIISKQAGYRVKIVERAGKKLRELLVKSDPFGGGDCMRKGCRPCLSKAITLKWKPCWRRSCN